MPYVIRVIDMETTGMEPPAEVVEVGYCDLTQAVDGGPWEVGRPVSWLCGVSAIPPEVRAVHHIGLAEVAGLAPFHPAMLLTGDAEGSIAAYAAHNYDFERRLLETETLRPVAAICTLKAALRVWPDAPGHSNGVLRYWLEDQGLLSLDHETAMPPHRAGPDAYVTAHILKALFAAGATGKEMVAWTREPRLLPTCPIGKFRGKPWPEVEGGFLQWMLKQADMEADLKWNANRELLRRAA